MPDNLKIIKIAFLAVLLILVQSCSWDNFTTYYNTYYNINRIMDQTEDEFGFQDEKKRVSPRNLIPNDEMMISESKSTGVPEYMREFVITQQKLQPVKNKLDSIEIKGSKILAHHPKSDYIEGTLFQMSKSYFYQNAWLNSQIKSSELIDRFPDGDYSPDAHLLMSKAYLVQRKNYEGKILLSRTVDISWQKQRYDVLSEAFRLEAELALADNDIDGAYRPYLQAIAQSNDNAMRAKWQVELASLLFKIGKFDKAEKEFAKVHKYSPDYLAYFEAKLYRASSLSRLGRIDEANEILEELDNDGKFEEWKPFVLAERMNILRFQNNASELALMEKFADSAYAGNAALMGPYYEMGMKYFNEKNYLQARTYFARSKGTRSPIFETSQRLYYLINEWDRKRSSIATISNKIKIGENLSDTVMSVYATELFELGRIHNQLGNNDSAVYYYEQAVNYSPKSDKNSARFLYAYSMGLKDSSLYHSDSLMNIIASEYPLTEYGQEAIRYFKYTDEFIIDTVAELYRSGDKFRRTGQYRYAVDQFTKLFTAYPDEKLAPKALYSVGWIFEKNMSLSDSAMYYYEYLLKKYPKTEYADDVRLSVAFLTAKQTGAELPDSLKFQIVTKEPKGVKGLKEQEFKTQNQKDIKGNKLDPQQMIKEPGSIMKSAEEALKQPFQMLKDIKIPDNPLDLFKSKDENKPQVQDTTSKTIPD